MIPRNRAHTTKRVALVISRRDAFSVDARVALGDFDPFSPLLLSSSSREKEKNALRKSF